MVGEESHSFLLSSVLRDHSQWYLGDHEWYWGWNWSQSTPVLSLWPQIILGINLYLHYITSNPRSKLKFASVVIKSLKNLKNLKASLVQANDLKTNSEIRHLSLKQIYIAPKDRWKRRKFISTKVY